MRRYATDGEALRYKFCASFLELYSAETSEIKVGGFILIVSSPADKASSLSGSISVYSFETLQGAVEYTGRSPGRPEESLMIITF